MDEHIAKAEKNERLYENLIGTEFNDWAVVALFYAALHYVDAFFLQESNSTPQNHGERNRRLRNNAALDQIRSHYLDLYALSIRARYELDPVSENLAGDIRMSHFVPVRAHIRALLNLT